MGGAVFRQAVLGFMKKKISWAKAREQAMKHHSSVGPVSVTALNVLKGWIMTRKYNPNKPFPLQVGLATAIIPATESRLEAGTYLQS